MHAMNSVINKFAISKHKLTHFPLFSRDHYVDFFADYKFPYVGPMVGLLSTNSAALSMEIT